MDQGSALSPLLFCELWMWKPYLENSELPYHGSCCILIVIAKTEYDVIKRLNGWKDNVNNRGIGVNMNKTQVMISRRYHKKLMQKAARLLLLLIN